MPDQLGQYENQNNGKNIDSQIPQPKQPQTVTSMNKLLEEASTIENAL